MEGSSRLKITFTALALGLLAAIVLGLIWFFFLGPATPVGLGWYVFSFAAGLSMIVLPCTLPLAFVIVPLSMGKGAAKGLGIAIAFGLGVALTLSMYGVIAAVVGEVAIGTLGAPLESVKNWLYFIAGAFAFVFALGEIGLVRFRMPSYTGAAPAFIQKQQDYLKALLLGLFLGNIGVGCPHPATPVILTRIAASGDIFYGWMLFFVHAVGRILPLIFLALLAILGVNALSWLVQRKDRVERATGWGMVFVAAFILVLGLFSHDWWVYSGQHTLLEEITQEERFLGIIVNRFNLAEPPHTHEIPAGTGLFGLPLWLGNWVLVGLWVLPLAWYYLRKRKDFSLLAEEEKKIEARVTPYRFWLFATLSLLLAVTFIWVLPDRFLNHTRRDDGHDGVEESGLEAMFGGEVHGGAVHHEGGVSSGLAVDLNVTPVPISVGTPRRLDFFVNEKPGNIPVPVSTLEYDHTKLMHVVGVRNDLNAFFHIHPYPTSTPGIFTVNGIFPQPGRYKIWSEIKKDGVNHAFGHPEFEVMGEGEKYSKEVSFGRSVVVDQYQVLLEYPEPIVPGVETDLMFNIHRASGGEVAVEPYLGADMHLSIIKDDLRIFVHTHPESGDNHALRPSWIKIALAHGEEEEATSGEAGGDAAISFHTVFPEVGVYKMFAQFRPQGIELPEDQALTASFWVKVEGEEALPRLPRWALAAVSIVLIIILSVVVRRYISVRS